MDMGQLQPHTGHRYAIFTFTRIRGCRLQPLNGEGGLVGLVGLEGLGGLVGLVGLVGVLGLEGVEGLLLRMRFQASAAAPFQVVRTRHGEGESRRNDWI